MQTHQIVLFVCIGLGMFAVIGGLAPVSYTHLTRPTT